MDKARTIFFAQAVCKRATKEEIDALQETVIIKVQKLVKELQQLYEEINLNECGYIDQMAETTKSPRV